MFIVKSVLGSVHGAPTGNATPFDSLGFGVIGRKLEEYSYLCPGFFPWVNPGPATHESGQYFACNDTILL